MTTIHSILMDDGDRYILTHDEANDCVMLEGYVTNIWWCKWDEFIPQLLKDDTLPHSEIKNLYPEEFI